MTKFYEIKCLEQTDYDSTSCDVGGSYGYQLPGMVFCSEPSCVACWPYRESHSMTNICDFPFPCPQEIIDDAERLVSEVPWDRKYSISPRFTAKVLYPYLTKWTRILIGKGYKIDGLLMPGSTFAPDILHVHPDDGFVDGDFVKIHLSFFFASERLKDALADCRGVYYRNTVMPRRPLQRPYFRMSPDELRWFDLAESIFQEELVKDNGSAVFCKKCGGLYLTKKSYKMKEAKSNYCRKNRILPAHLIIPEIDIFTNFEVLYDYFFSEKAFSILKNFEVPGLEVTEYEVRDDPLWFDDTYWETCGIAEYGEEEE